MCVACQQQQQQRVSGDSEVDDVRWRASDADAVITDGGGDRSPELQRLQDELVGSKLREAEAHLNMKEFEQKLLQLQRNWQASSTLSSSYRILYFILLRGLLQ